MKTILMQLLLAICLALPSYGQSSLFDAQKDEKGTIDSNIQNEECENITLDIPMIGLVSIKKANKAVQEATAPFFTTDIDRTLEMLSHYSFDKEEIEKLNQGIYLKEE